MYTYFLNPNRAIACVIGVLTIAIAINRAKADVFVIDTNQSAMTISGSVSGYSFTPQGSGSLTTVVGGTIQATQGGGTIQFTGQSAIAAVTNGSWQPLPGGSAGAYPADFGGFVSAFGGLVTIEAALRSILLDVTNPPVAVTGGQFDATTLTFGFPTNSTSTLDYLESGLESGSGSKILTGDATNNVSQTATLTTVGGLQTLTIPVNTQFTFSVVSADDTLLLLTGQLVATNSSSSSTPLTIGSTTVSNHVVTLRWQSSPGQNFEVLSGTNIAQLKTNAINVTSGTSNYSWSETNPAPSSYYRLAQ